MDFYVEVEGAGLSQYDGTKRRNREGKENFAGFDFTRSASFCTLHTRPRGQGRPQARKSPDKQAK